jgi:hypothetical protein
MVYFYRFLLLLGVMLLPQAAWAQRSAPFDGNEFTTVSMSDSYVELSIPFYDDRGSDRFMNHNGVSSSLQYTDDGGVTWRTIMYMSAGDKNDDQNEANWYWVDVNKDGGYSPKVECYRSRQGSWSGAIGTGKTTIQCLRVNVNSLSPTYLKVRVYHDANGLSARPKAFRVYAHWHWNSHGDYDDYWYLDSRQSPYEVWRPGWSMHQPVVSGYTINSDGTITVSATIPNYNEWDDRGSVSYLGYRNARNIKIDNAYIGKERGYDNTSAAAFGSITTTARNRAFFNASHELRADNGRYDYQPSYSYAISNPFNMPPYPCPSNLTASANNGNVTLGWNMSGGTAESIADNYQFYWRKGSEAWRQVSNITKTYVTGEAHPSVTFPYPELDAGTNNYQFLVARAKFAYSNAAFNAVSASVSIATDKIRLTGINANLQSDAQSVKLTWATDGGRTEAAFRYRIYRKAGAGGSFTQVKEVTTDKEKEYIDNDISDCTAYLYEVRVYDGSNEYEEKATSEAIIRPMSDIGTISDLHVSKGFYNDRVNISWKVSAGAGFSRFAIMRKVKNLPNAAEQQIYEFASSGLQQYSYDDMNGSAGTYYDYRVVAWTECSGIVNAGGSLVSTGFKQPYGLVSGKVSYGTADIAVEGVSIKAIGESDYANKSLAFTRDAGTGIRTDYKAGTLSNTACTFQAWVMVRNYQNSVHSFMDAAGKYAVEVDDSNIRFSVYKGDDWQYDEYEFNSTTFPRGVYKNVSITYQVSGGTGTAILYLDGEAVETVTNEGVTAYTFPSATAADSVIYFGRYWETLNNNNWDGYMDEIRLWNRALTPHEIKNNYNSYLSGGESGLTLYYRLDEQAGDEIFDISKQNGVYNENHGTLLYNGGINMRSLVVPDAEQLSIRTVTDANGAYILNTIPYTGDGSMFTLSPSMGEHRFNPSDKPLYFNQQSAAYSNINFSDISSFNVRGRVVYEGGNYPVRGCSFEVDGQTIVTSGGEAVQSDADGAFEISVPIGSHSVRVVKSGHTFAGDGYLRDGEGKNLYFNAPVADVKFEDLTKVKLIGRVAGGSAEDGKPLGFGESKNNIGIETLVLSSTLPQYNFATVPFSETYSHNDGQWHKHDGLADDHTTVDYGQKNLTIHVSAVSGEFVAMVYPEAYNIQPISVTQGVSKPVLLIKEDAENIDLSATAVPDASYLQTEIRTWADSAYISGVPGVVDHWQYFDSSDTVRYAAKWTYKYQSTPTFDVVQTIDGTKTDYFGEKTYILEDAMQGTYDTLALYDGQTQTYLFSKPVFRQGVKYGLRFNAYEEYTNHVSDPAVTVRYPVIEGEVNLSNNLQVSPAPESYETDSAGVLDYQFIAGAPNLTTASSDFYATLTIGAVTYKWNMAASGLVADDETPLTAWQLGEKSTGTNFMTAGPDQLTVILRDPPGTASSAFIEEGTSISSTSTTNTGVTIAEDMNLTTSLGTRITTFVGLGAGIITSSGVKADVTGGLSSEQTYTSINEETTTTTFTERFETSASSGYVGAMGDVFIGNSTNILYGLTNGVSIKKGVVEGAPWATAGDYSLAPSAAIAYGQEFNTRFAYTAYELENIMLPKWRNSIRERLLPVGTSEPNTAVITEPVYVSKLAPDDVNYGKWNLDEVFKSDAAYNLLKPYNGASYTIYFPDSWTPTSEPMKNFQDSVLWANNQIAMWEAVLAQNEQEKVEMTDIHNYSLGGGSSIRYSEQTKSSASYKHSFGYNITPSVGAVVGGDVMGIGMELKTNVSVKTVSADAIGESADTVITTGFTLSEDGFLDEITVDYGKTASGTFAFKTRGGQTSCPYEDEEVTRYYQPGQHVLSEATMRIEAPVITVTSANQVLNVPANRPASFTLAMQNESEINADVWFNLIVDEKSNPDGAELKIDGAPVGNGRNFLVPAGATLTKTVTLGKGTADDYNNIGLILRSTCQNDPTSPWEVIADTCWISAHFVPACSDVTIASPANNFIVNTETGDTLKVTLQNFDVNFPNFGYIRLEARAAGTPTWTTLRTFYPSSLFGSVSDGTAEDIAGRAAIVYDWVMKNAADGQYELRATTASVNIVNNEIVGSPLSTYSTAAITGYKDMSKPVAMGAPSPANGIYGLGDELSVSFNENINAAMVIADNVVVTYGAAAAPVPVSFVVSSNKITVDYPEDYFSLLEDSVLTLTVSDIYDMHGNKSEPVTWQALVNRNALQWETDEVSLVKEAGKALSFTAKIRNDGSSSVSYSFASLPQWLSVNHPSGTLAALTVKELTFNVSSGVNPGVYTPLIGLTSGNGIVKKMPLNLTVTGMLPEGWTVNPADYESNMTITGRLQIEGVYQSDPSDILAAFIGDECVGLTSPVQPLTGSGAYYTFLTVYGNSSQTGQSIKLKIWDASTGYVHSVVSSSLNGAAIQDFTFAADATYGVAATPVVHNASNVIEQRINLSYGWNWLSVNVLSTYPSIIQQFKDRIGSAGELLKGQNAYIQSPTWSGSLSAIDAEKMYMLKTNAAKALVFEGAPADPASTALTLAHGWNWLGYVPQFALPVDEALADLSPTLNDQIKGQTAYRTYAGDGVGWIGTLNYLRSGEGYMYNSLATAGKTFNYPSSASQLYRGTVSARSAAAMPGYVEALGSDLAPLSAASTVVNRWTPDIYKYPNTMTMTSVVLDENIEQHSDMLEIGAFAANGECRGSVILQHEPLVPSHPYLGFLMLFGENGDRLTFKVYNHANGEEYSADNVVSFASDAIHGTPLNPYQIHSLITGLEAVGGDGSSSEIAVYPNPVVSLLMIKNYDMVDIEHITITDVTGRTHYSAPAPADGIIDVSTYPSGIYIIRFAVASGNASTGVRVSNPHASLRGTKQSPESIITLKFVKK